MPHSGKSTPCVQRPLPQVAVTVHQYTRFSNTSKGGPASRAEELHTVAGDTPGTVSVQGAKAPHVNTVEDTHTSSEETTMHRELSATFVTKLDILLICADKIQTTSSDKTGVKHIDTEEES